MSALEKYQNKCREETKTRILAALQGAGWIRYQNLKEKTELAKSTLSKYLKELVEEKILERKRELESGEWPIPVSYRIAKKEKSFVEAKVGRYDAVSFIETLESPVYKSGKKGKITVSAFMSPIEEQYRESAQRKVNGIVGSKSWVWRVLGWQFSKLMPGKKIAVIITMEGKQDN